MESVQYIHDHYDQPLWLEDLCARTMMSRTNFADDSRSDRLDLQPVLGQLSDTDGHATLTEPELTVTDVCFKVGFNELPYFCRTFKKYTGTTPAYYKRTLLKPWINTPVR